MINITPLRQEILSIMKMHDNGLKAYDLLEILTKTNPSIKPNTVYRILNLLVTNHVLHKIQGSSVFTLCSKSEENVKHILLTCDKCLKITELVDEQVLNQLDIFYKKNNFNIKNYTYELSGICKDCK
jgi:Fur family transcriptional regulator, zinc uptake regulator